MATITIPLGAAVSVERLDGTQDTYTFQGTDAGGPIFEGAEGVRINDVGVYKSITITSPE